MPDVEAGKQIQQSAESPNPVLKSGLDDLAAGHSAASTGVPPRPIIVRPVTGRGWLVGQGRPAQAGKRDESSMVCAPVLGRGGDEINLVGNVQREDLSAVENRLCVRLRERFDHFRNWDGIAGEPHPVWSRIRSRAWVRTLEPRGRFRRWCHGTRSPGPAGQNLYHRPGRGPEIRDDPDRQLEVVQNWPMSRCRHRSAGGVIRARGRDLGSVDQIIAGGQRGRAGPRFHVQPSPQLQRRSWPGEKPRPLVTTSRLNPATWHRGAWRGQLFCDRVTDVVHQRSSAELTDEDAS